MAVKLFRAAGAHHQELDRVAPLGPLGNTAETAAGDDHEPIGLAAFQIRDDGRIGDARCFGPFPVRSVRLDRPDPVVGGVAGRLPGETHLARAGGGGTQISWGCPARSVGQVLGLRRNRASPQTRPGLPEAGPPAQRRPAANQAPPVDVRIPRLNQRPMLIVPMLAEHQRSQLHDSVRQHTTNTGVEV